MNRNLQALPYELIYHRYKIEEYLKFKFYDSMEREIQANSCRDRIVEYARGHVLFFLFWKITLLPQTVPAD